MENFKPVPDFETLYHASDLGYILGLKRGKALKSTTNMFGYQKIQLTKENKGYDFVVHRLVALSFLPNPGNLPFVNHIDGDKSNNILTNLEWITPQGNVHHAIKSGLRKSKLSPTDVIEIRALKAHGVSSVDLGLKYGVSRITINAVVRGHHHDLDNAVSANHTPRATTLTAEMLEDIRASLAIGHTCNAIAAKHGVDSGMISQIKRGVYNNKLTKST